MKITKKLLKHDGRDLRLSKCREWLTNGTWMIRRDLLDEPELHATPELLRARYGEWVAKSEFGADNVTPRATKWERFDRTDWTVTRRCRGHTSDLALYLGNAGSVAFFDRVYIDWLGLPTLYADRHATPYKGFSVATMVSNTDHPGIVIAPHAADLEHVTAANALRPALAEEEQP